MYQRDKDRSEFDVLASELSGQCREYELKVPPVLEIARAEEGGTELAVRKQPLRGGLRDRGLARSGQPIQPVDGKLVRGPCPEFYGIQNGSARALETTFAVAVSVLGAICNAEVIEGRRFDYQSFTSVTRRLEQRTFQPASWREGYSTHLSVKGRNSP